jgi:hypothetical protein
MKVSYKHTINAPLKKIISAYKNLDFYIKKQKASGAISVEIINSSTEKNGSLKFRAKIKEPSRLPSFIRQSDIDEYIDDSYLDVTKNTMEWNITPTFMADKMQLKGVVTFIPNGGTTEVVYETDMKIKIPLIGKKAEKIGLKKTEEETQKQADFLEKWVNADR